MPGEHFENPESVDRIAYCGAAMLMVRANQELAGALQAEALDATGGNSAPDWRDASRICFSNAQPQGSGYQEEAREVRRRRLEAVTPESTRCELCLGRVSVNGDGVKAPRCVLTLGCERSWIEQHPEFYNPLRHDPHNTPQQPVKPPALPCGEDGCSAVHRVLSPTGRLLPRPELVAGQCGVDIAGRGWRERAKKAWEEEPLMAPHQDRPPVNDGIPLTEIDVAEAAARLIAEARGED